MAENTWPLKNKLPEGHQFFTKAGLLEFLSGVDDETPIWLNNYWQPVRQIMRHPVKFMKVCGPDCLMEPRNTYRRQRSHDRPGADGLLPQDSMTRLRRLCLEATPFTG